MKIDKENNILVWERSGMFQDIKDACRLLVYDHHIKDALCGLICTLSMLPRSWGGHIEVSSIAINTYKILQSIFHISFEEYFTLIEVERERQLTLHPDNSNLHHTDWTLIILEEYGEMIKEYNNQNWENFKKEAIEFVAVAIRCAEETEKRIDDIKDYDHADPQKTRRG